MNRNLIIVALTAIALLVVVYLAFDIHRAGEEEVLSQFRDHQSLISRQLAKEIESYLRDRARGLQVLSSFASLQHRDRKQMPVDVQAHYEYWKQMYIKAVSVYDDQGAMIYSTTEGANDSSYAQNALFSEAKKSENKGKVLISPIFWVTDREGCSDPERATPEGDKLPCFRFYLFTPLYQEAVAADFPQPTKKFVGVLAMTVDLEELLAERLAFFSLKTKLQQIWVMDKDGTLLFQSEHPELTGRSIHQRDASCNQCHTSFDYVETMLTMKRGTIDYELKNFPKKLAAYAPMEFENASWTVVVNTRHDEAMAFAAKSLRGTLLLLGIVVFALIGGASLIYRNYRLKVRAEEEAKQWRERRALEDKIHESEERYRLLSESALTGVYLIQDNLFRYVNPALASIFGYQVEELINRLGPLDLTAAEDRPLVTENIRKRVEGEAHDIRYSFRGQRKDGSLIEVEVHGARVEYNGKSAVIGTLLDITERKRAEKENKMLAQAIKSIGECVSITDSADNIIYVNSAFLKTYGYEESELIGKNISLVRSPNNPPEVVSEILPQTLGGGWQGELLNRRKSGDEFPVSLTTAVVRDENGQPIALISVAQDVTERKRAEEALQMSESRLRAIIEGALDSIFIKDRDLFYVLANPAMEKLFNLPMNEIIGKTDRQLFGEEIGRHIEEIDQQVLAGKTVAEEPTKPVRGIPHTFHTIKVPLRNQNGEVMGICGIARDISERKRAEDQIKASLKEKEVLLKEIHHRVKNNMQIISSLLNLQAGYIRDPQALNAFKESQNRIKSMALIHEKLYQAKSLAKINFAEYVRDLSENLFQSYDAYSRKITLEMNVQNVFLGIDTAIPCGLIINELVCNSLKHAFPNGREGGVKIDFQPVGELIVNEDRKNQYVLVVGDDGVGLPVELDFKKTNTLGLQLVNTLIDQLAGSVEVVRSSGSIFKISFAV